MNEEETLDIIEDSDVKKEENKEKTVDVKKTNAVAFKTNNSNTNTVVTPTPVVTPVFQAPVDDITKTISEISENINNENVIEKKEGLSGKKKIILIILSILLFIDILVLILYIIGFEKVFSFIK